MRRIGQIEREADAENFTLYLISEGIDAQADADQGAWTIWVHDEDRVAEASRALDEFRLNPLAARYAQASRAAEVRLRTAAEKQERARRNTIAMGKRWGNSGLRRKRPLVMTVLAICVVLGMMSRLGQDRGGAVMRTLMFVDIERMIPPAAEKYTPRYWTADVRQGQVWRVITPAFLHYGVTHIAFNLIMFYQLGSVIEDRRGTFFLGCLILSTAAVGNLAQALVPIEWDGSPFGAGLSGVVYGLFGYVWMKSVYDPAFGIRLERSTVVIMIGWMLLGMFGILEKYFGTPVANWTHGGGFLVGVACGYLPVLLRSLAR